MAQFPHSPIAAVASGLLATFGRPVTIRTPVVASTDREAGTVTPGTPVDVAANAYFDEVHNYKMDESLARAGDRVAIIDALVEPDKIIIRDGEEWTVIDATPYELGSGVAAWQALVRR